MNPSDPHAQVQELRRQLQSLLEAAKANERKLDRFDALERRLVAVSSMEELVNLLLVDCREDFQLDAAELWLLDQDEELRRALPALPMIKAPKLLDSHAGLKDLFGTVRTTRLVGPGHSEALLAQAFDPQAGVRSAALLPLIRQGLLIGSLHFGSRDPQRYDAASGTKFLDRLAAIAAIAIESMLNRERLRRAGMTDGLTGVHNRRYFDHRSLIEFSQAVRHRYPLACLFLDIDHFKSINDRHGHPAGDEVLRQVGGLILRSLRTGDLAARYGGEEFVVLLPRTDLAGAREVAERIRLMVQEAPFITPDGGTVSATVSVGLAMLPAEATSFGELLQAADRAVYQAKRSGRNRTVTHEDAPA
ncbi:sensor domain-containing diguanylate cyclase [Roseateles sp. BYS87W]|uniref:diguanylate cyclase n=1 Tax=Pelomonas baiyunensis TaxID=3299026 RepID=A0ABW7H1K8_9BURK